MKKYLYTGQISYVTIARVDHCLQDGNEYSLPADSSHVKTLVATGALKLVEEKKETQSKKNN